MSEPRHITLLRATRDLLTKADNSNIVEDIMSLTAFWDESECDGACLLQEISDWLDMHDTDKADAEDGA
jgi:hypothetical protein